MKNYVLTVQLNKRNDPSKRIVAMKAFFLRIASLSPCLVGKYVTRIFLGSCHRREETITDTGHSQFVSKQSRRNSRKRTSQGHSATERELMRVFLIQLEKLG